MYQRHGPCKNQYIKPSVQKSTAFNTDWQKWILQILQKYCLTVVSIQENFSGASEIWAKLAFEF